MEVVDRNLEPDLLDTALSCGKFLVVPGRSSGGSSPRRSITTPIQ
jgi:hypothetical protein